MKSQILIHLTKLAHERKLTAKKALDELTDARNNETKSTAGDKHETARAMVQAEIHRAEERLSVAESLLYSIGEIDTSKQYERIEKGALVRIGDMLYFISVGIGKIELNNTIVYCISPGSPIGSAMMGKSKGDSITFQGRSLIVASVE